MEHKVTQSRDAVTTQAHQLSIIIPMYNEQDNVEPMVQRVHEALEHYPHPWELIIVDDGSYDHTVERLFEQQQKYGEHVRVIVLQRNFGQTAAMQAGIDEARGDVIAMLDGDLQNDPEDITRLVKRLLDEDLDVVTGWRFKRKDSWLRKIPSRIANRLIGKVTGVRIHDYGCSLKVYRAKILKSIRLYGEMHRFIPAWVAAVTSPSRIKEEVVTHHARQFGVSKYGISRTTRVILDLIAVYFFLNFRSRPGHFFGKIGLYFGGVGTLILSYLLFVKIILQQDIGNRPLLLIGILFVVMAVQFLTTGVMSELLTRTYFEASDKKPYLIHNAEEIEGQIDAAWHNAPPSSQA